MSKSARLYGAAALVLIGFPLLLAFWSSTSAIVAILLFGVGAYAAAVWLLIASFWHRHRYGTWPVEILNDPTLAPRLPRAAEDALEAGGSARARALDPEEADERYRPSRAMQGWFSRFSSNL